MPATSEYHETDFLFEEVQTLPSRRGRRIARWLTVLAVIASVAGGWVVVMRPWEAPDPIQATIGVRSPSSLLGNNDDILLGEVQARWMRVQRSMVKSTNVLSLASAWLRSVSPPLSSQEGDLETWLKQGIKVVDDSETSFTISMPGAPRVDQPRIVDAVTRAYFEVAREHEIVYREERLKSLEEAFARYRDRVMAKRDEFRAAEQRIAGTTQLDLLRDDLAIQEAMMHRLGVAVEERKLDMSGPPFVYLMDSPKLDKKGRPRTEAK